MRELDRPLYDGREDKSEEDIAVAVSKWSIHLSGRARAPLVRLAQLRFPLTRSSLRMGLMSLILA
jgi:hypothetical protein